jgi:hypothetical protein
VCIFLLTANILEGKLRALRKVKMMKNPITYCREMSLPTPMGRDCFAHDRLEASEGRAHPDSGES